MGWPQQDVTCTDLHSEEGVVAANPDVTCGDQVDAAPNASAVDSRDDRLWAQFRCRHGALKPANLGADLESTAADVIGGAPASVTLFHWARSE